ncbi:3-hydroxyacyl-CoA dehydrogenase NAD-binding domain-containing protein [Rhodococcus sp. T7]|uniref:3-hydroxyacyl-CoA dehydrogenase NAD-binding domain-containing protein n=1 Tax=Rhodococcus sp. T7 TaxID=627444 RepID=UPI001357CB51|nr:3-hydroxyacyl-CoA dehydrogenase NAD-binding domain-containing protein [Rhodococcus sp. T7]KAF0957619.1 Fatty acid oxidation complex subunit alpha [Rhodococcus sp. T7]KAF0963309.1 Fatty acid oxidation complex subunit alpha [Rhodococcus sp. T7]
MSATSTITWSQDSDGIVLLTLDDPDQSANTMNDQYVESMGNILDRLEAERDSVTGVVITSAKKTFFAGGNLNDLVRATAQDAVKFTNFANGIKAQLRRLETLGRPVVAAVNGAALGGGLEITLATHHRIAVDAKSVIFGLPEVTLGLLPGAGGITRTVRMLGLEKALTSLLLTGKSLSPAAAKTLGLVDDLVTSADELVPAAKKWIQDNPEGGVQPWDRKGFRIPGGTALNPAVTANLRRTVAGAPVEAPRAILAAAAEGALVDLDTAAQIETRYFVGLVTGQVSTNMIKAQFFDLQRIKAGGSRPEGHPRFSAKKVGVIGAGMMGAAVAYVSAKAGIDVVLQDMSIESARKGKAYAEKLEAKALARGTTTEEKSAALLARITPTDNPADFVDVDFVVEAVFESVEVKQAVFKSIQDVVAPDAVLGSNTSTLPITTLAEGVARKEDFIGVHFFSPVERMPLVEIIVGAHTAPTTLAKAFDFAQQIKKTPIVVNDSRGFFTSRVITKFLDEAAAAVGEGVEPVIIEQAGAQAGYPAPPLQLLDELTLTLPRKIRQEARAAVEADGGVWVEHGSEAVLDRLVEELDRRGRSTGGGFYEYDESGGRVGLWPGLRGAFQSGSTEVPFDDLKERMLFAEALESVRCLDEGVLTSVADANVGSLLGIGFPAWTGGVLQYINGYPGGIAAFVERARVLASRYGTRFEPPASLVAKAEHGETYE